jgi:hypothetical protein
VHERLLARSALANWAVRKLRISITEVGKRLDIGFFWDCLKHNPAGKVNRIGMRVPALQR